MKKQFTFLFFVFMFLGQINLMSQVSKIDTHYSFKQAVSTNDSINLLGYYIYRNGVKLNSDPITDLQFVDSVPDDGAYAYYVTAVYQEGESMPSNTVEVLIDQKSVLHNYVVFEEGTGTWCQYCPGAALGLEDLIANGKQVLGIAYHNGDNYANDAATIRNNFYGITGFPTAVFDGITKVEGGSHTESLYPSYLPVYEERAQAHGPFLMTSEGTVNGTSYSATIHMEKVGTLSGTNLKVIAAVVEDDINFIWQGQSKLNAVERMMVPNANGTIVDFRVDSIKNIELNFEAAATWNLNNCTLIAFIQDFTSKEILQATKLDLSDFKTSAPLKSTGLTTLFSPYGLKAEYTMVSPTVDLTWNSAGSSSWMEWDNGINASAIGDGNSVLDFDVASRWEKEDIRPLAGMAITKVAFFPNESTCKYSVKIWKGAETDSLVIDSLLTSITAQTWNEVTLSQPMAIDTAQELWVGYYNDNSAKKFSAGCDAGPAVVGKGDKIRLYTSGVAGAWENVSSYGIDANWNIKFYIEPIVESVVDTTAISEIHRPELMVYPNPASQSVTVESDVQIRSLYVIGINGQIVLASQEVGKATKIDLSAYQSGIYFIKIVTDSGFAFKKLVVE